MRHQPSRWSSSKYRAVALKESFNNYYVRILSANLRIWVTTTDMFRSTTGNWGGKKVPKRKEKEKKKLRGPSLLCLQKRRRPPFVLVKNRATDLLKKILVGFFSTIKQKFLYKKKRRRRKRKLKHIMYRLCVSRGGGGSYSWPPRAFWSAGCNEESLSPLLTAAARKTT